MKDAKIILFEGIDNIGKDTVIKEFSKEYRCKMVHFTSPEKYSKLSLQPKKVQELQFLEKFMEIEDACKSGKYDYVILNRSHIGEYVYGHLYRNENTDWIFDDFEKMFDTILRQTYYVLLTTSSFEFNLKNDDGLSHKATLRAKENEQKRFLETLHRTIIPKNITIDTFDSLNNTWQPLKSIVNQIKVFINEHNK